MHYILHKVFTVLGGQLYIHSVRNFYNTSCYSNCNGRFENGYYCCYASDDIPADSELLLDYRITQPENNLKSASSTSKSGAAFVEITLLFRQRQIGKAGHKWHADAAYIKVSGRWCYFYRCIGYDDISDKVGTSLS